jgi:hypothetical protein
MQQSLERAGEGAQARFTRNIAETRVGLGSTSPPFDSPARTAEDTTATPADDLTASTSPAIVRGTAEDTAEGGFMGWLQVAHAASVPPDGSDVGQIMQSRLSKLETGTQALGDVTELRYIARKLGIPPERLGVLPDRSADAHQFASQVSDRPGPIRDSQEHWRAIRCQLNAHRAVLGDLAAELYPAQQRIPGTTVLTSASWLPDGPVDLAEIELAWRAEAPAPQLGGKAAPSAGARPLMASGERYDRYSRALRDLARPTLLDNRVSYRLLDAAWSGSRGMLGFNYTSYFDVLDIGEALGHEFTQAWLTAGNKRPSFADLPFRRSIIDPFDLSARPILPSINTLTIVCPNATGGYDVEDRANSCGVALVMEVWPSGVAVQAEIPNHRKLRR